MKLLDRRPTYVLVCWSSLGTETIGLKTLAWREKGGIHTAILLKVIKSNIFFFSSSATPKCR